MKRLGLGDALPATAFIDRGGQIVSRILGPLTKAELEERIDYLLGTRASAPEPLVNHIEHKEEENHAHGSVS